MPSSAVVTLSHEKELRDVLIVAGTDPVNAPAVFDPSDLYPNGTNSPAALGDTLDPEIFDRARAAADAVTDETGLF